MPSSPSDGAVYFMPAESVGIGSGLLAGLLSGTPPAHSVPVGWDFYGSTFADLVASLVQLRPAPWSLLKRVLAMCPPGAVSAASASGGGGGGAGPRHRRSRSGAGDSSGDAGGVSDASTGAGAAGAPAGERDRPSSPSSAGGRSTPSTAVPGGGGGLGADGGAGPSASDAGPGDDAAAGTAATLEAPAIVAVTTRQREAILAVARFLVLSDGQYADRLVPQLGGWVLSLPSLAAHDQNESFAFALVALVLQAARVLSYDQPALAQRLRGAVLHTLDGLCSSQRAGAALAFLTGGDQPLFRAHNLGTSPLPAMVGMLRALASGAEDPVDHADRQRKMMEKDADAADAAHADAAADSGPPSPAHGPSAAADAAVVTPPPASTPFLRRSSSRAHAAAAAVAQARTEQEVLPFTAADVERVFSQMFYFLKVLDPPSPTSGRSSSRQPKASDPKLVRLTAANIRALILLVMKQLIRAGGRTDSALLESQIDSYKKEAERSFEDKDLNVQEAAVELMVQCAVSATTNVVLRNNVRQNVLSVLRRTGSAASPKVTMMQVLLDGLRDLCAAFPREVLPQAVPVMRDLLQPPADSRDAASAAESTPPGGAAAGDEDGVPAAASVGHPIREMVVDALTQLLRMEVPTPQGVSFAIADGGAAGGSFGGGGGGSVDGGGSGGGGGGGGGSGGGGGGGGGGSVGIGGGFGGSGGVMAGSVGDDGDERKDGHGDGGGGGVSFADTPGGPGGDDDGRDGAGPDGGDGGRGRTHGGSFARGTDFVDSMARKVLFSLSNEVFLAIDKATGSRFRGGGGARDSSSSGGESDGMGTGTISSFGARRAARVMGGGGGRRSASSAARKRAKLARRREQARIVDTIDLIRHLTCAIHHPALSQYAGQLLIDHFARNQQRQWIVQPLTHAMVDICLLDGSQELFTAIADSFFGQYERPFDQPQRVATTEMPATLLKLATGARLCRSAHREALRHRFLVLFSQLGLAVQRKVKSSRSSITGFASAVGELLPALAESLRAAPGETASALAVARVSEDAARVKLFRNVWVYIVLFKFHASGTLWPAEWAHAVRTLAVHTPVLVARGAREAQLSVELTFSAVLRHGSSMESLNTLRNELAACLPEQSSAVRAAPDPQFVFAYSIYHLETLRVSDGTFKSMFEYLADDGVEAAGLSVIVAGISDKVFARFMGAMRDMGRTAARLTTLEDHCQYLIAHCAHRFARIRDAARRYVKDLVAEFAQLTASESVLATLLDSIEAITARLSRGNNPDFGFRSHREPRLVDFAKSALGAVAGGRHHGRHGRGGGGGAGAGGSAGGAASGGAVAAAGSSPDAHDESAPLVIPSCDYALHVPAVEGKLAALLVDLIEIGAEWLRRAATADGSETVNVILQGYISRLRSAQARMQVGPAAWTFGALSSTHSGVALALHNAAPTIHSTPHIPKVVAIGPERAAGAAGAGGAAATAAAGARSAAHRYGDPATAVSHAALFHPAVAAMSSQRAQRFAASAELRAHYMGLVAGMAAFHKMDLSGSARSGTAFPQLMFKQLVSSYTTLLRTRTALADAEIAQERTAELGEWLHDMGALEAVTVPPSRFHGGAYGDPSGAGGDDSDSDRDSSDGSDSDVSEASLTQLATGGGGGGGGGGSAGAGESKMALEDGYGDDEGKATPPPQSTVKRMRRAALRKAKNKMSALVKIAKKGFHRGDGDDDKDGGKGGAARGAGAGGTRTRDGITMSNVAMLSVAGHRAAEKLRRRLREDFTTDTREVLFRTAAFFIWADQEAHTAARAIAQRDEALRLRRRLSSPAKMFPRTGLGGGGGGASGPAVAAHALTAHLSQPWLNPALAVDADLLHYLAWFPAHCFTVPAVTAAVFCWQWVVTALPSESVRLMCEIAASWAWTIEQGYGLFSGTSRYNADGTPVADPAAADAAGGSGGTSVFTAPAVPVSDAYAAWGTGYTPESLCAVEPHRVWIKFWEERFSVVRNRNVEELAIIGQAVSAAVSDVARLSTAPDTLGPRVLLLRLGFSVLHASHEHSGGYNHDAAATGADTGGGAGASASGAGSGGGSGGRGRGGGDGGGDGDHRGFMRLGGVGAWNGTVPGVDEMLTEDTAATPRADTDASRAGGGGGGGGGAIAMARPAATVGHTDEDSVSADGSRDSVASGANGGGGAGGETELVGVGQVASDMWAATAVGSLALFRERLLLAALQWFETNPSWYEVATSTLRVEEDFPSVVALCRLLKKDEAFWYSSDIPEGEDDDETAAAAGASIMRTVSSTSRMRGDGAAGGFAFGVDGAGGIGGGGSGGGGRGYFGGGDGSGRGGRLPPGSPSLSGRSISEAVPASHGALGGVHGHGHGHSLSHSHAPLVRAATMARARAASTDSGLGSNGSFKSTASGAAGAPPAGGTSLLSRLSLTAGAGADGGGDTHSTASAGRTFERHASVSLIRDAAEAAAASAGDGASPSPTAGTMGADGMPPRRPSLANVRAAHTWDAPDGAAGGGGRVAIALPTALPAMTRRPSSFAGMGHAVHADGDDGGAGRERWGSGGGGAHHGGVGGSGRRAGGGRRAPPRVSATSKTVAWVRSLQSVLLTLMSHEIDRLVAWHNPTNLPHKHLRNEREFSLDAQEDLSFSRLQELVRAAWAVKPRLAVKLLRRFRHSAVRTELERLVTANPRAVADEPDAATLLACATNVTNDAPELESLAFMAPASFPTLLMLMSRCHADQNYKAPLFAHRHVAMYVVRSMRCFPAETVVFYLPQLVHALRHDSHRLLSEFLFETSQTSVLIAHQLMWLLVTESKVEPPEHGAPVALDSHGFQGQLPGEDSLPGIVTALAARIERTFVPSARALYEREFAFFERITEISGKLLTEVKTSKDADANKAKRKAAIKKYLLALRDQAHERQKHGHGHGHGDHDEHKGDRDGAHSGDGGHGHGYGHAKDEDGGAGLSAGAYAALGGGVALNDPSEVLYMPTNPDRRVISVDLESGTPMQSAAKCPYLLLFTVTPFDGPDATLRAAEAEERRQRRREERKRRLEMQLAGRDRHTLRHSRLSRAKAEWRGRRRTMNKNIRLVGTKVKRATRKGFKKSLVGAKRVGSSVKSGARRAGSKLKQAIGRGHGHGNRERGAGSFDSAGDLDEEGSTLSEDGKPSAARERLRGGGGERGGHGGGAEHAEGAEHDGEGEAGPIATPTGNRRAHRRRRRDLDKGRDRESEVRGVGSERARSSRKSVQHAAMRPAHRHTKLVRAPSIHKAGTMTKQACIFKVHDDCRQDALAIQVIQLFKAVFDSTGLGLYLFPYRVIPSRTGPDKSIGGIIECVPNVKSRDEIGKAGFPTLMHYFQNRFGRPDGKAFEAARRNMIRSLSAYAVVCFALQIKDRHNGNLLVDDDGHMIHIDFGFLLGTSPGGNMGFESAAFKLTQEMIDVMGGEQDAEPFVYFTELSVRAFLAARESMDAAVGLVAGMADSGFPCFKFADTITKVRNRFRPEDNDLRACKFMKEKVFDAYNKLTTIIYDGIQKLQNNIHSDWWQ